jgi:hypothetical protein
VPPTPVLGPNNYASGSYGRIDLGAAPPTLGAPPVVTLTVPASPLVGTVALSATVTDTIAVAKVEFWVHHAGRNSDDIAVHCDVG